MKIGEFAKKTGLSIHTIRYYEKIGILKKNMKDNSGHRVYSDFDMKWMKFISCLKATGMSLEHILQFISLMEKGKSTIPDRISIMKKQRINLEKRISLLKEYLSHIDYKINNFDEIMK